jgi:hypothetical protein
LITRLGFSRQVAFDQHYPHLFVYLREREEMKRRLREQFKLSPKQYEHPRGRLGVREVADQFSTLALAGLAAAAPKARSSRKRRH